MSNFKLEFTLKQHTPLIHFQSDQVGATLRATELKSKLDRFLLNRVPELKSQAKKHPNGSLSLDYKVKIEPDLSQVKEEDKRNNGNKPNYFGNMGDGKNKYTKKHIKNFKITFLTFTSTIKDALEKNIEAFLANTNFGTRQSKGYGCFYLADIPFDTSSIKEKVYYFDSTVNNWENDIKLFYSFLRAGINHGVYIKAAIFFYAKEQGITWDKKAIKQRYFNDELRQKQKKYPEQDNAVNYNSNNKKLIRDLFGLSSSQSWKSYRNATITKENPELERFKSPITFKPIIQKDKKTVKVYFWANKSYEMILNKTFTIQKNGHGDLILSTPSEFSFDDFFEKTFTKDITTFSDAKYKNKSQYQTIENILNTLKSQVRSNS